MQYGLLGKKLGHSYSPLIHGALGNYPYSLFEVAPEDLQAFLCSHSCDGFNVTIPYKKAVIPFCKELSPQAQALGAVNTVLRRPDGSLIGHNTDFFGFAVMLSESGITVSGKKVLVLGSGGASNTASAVLRQKGASVVVISRNGENHYGNLHLHQDAAMIVNATPVGMYPSNGESPICLANFPQLEGVLDLIYNPARTRLLLDAEQRGLVAVNGLQMLVAQAKESAEWFMGKKIPDYEISRIHRMLKLQTENILLIGMPGSGKSTVGKLLAEKTEKKFVDADAHLVQKYGRTIPEIFEENGEVGFREMETAVLEELGKQSGLVIATGGGCVTREENYPLLHQNGTIFWLERDLSKLPTEGRPLSQKGNLQEMYLTRKPMYMRFADHRVKNDGDPSATADGILAILEGSK